MKVVDTQSALQHYFHRAYVAFLAREGGYRTQKDFAEFLGISRPRLNHYYNGRRKEMDYETAMLVAQKTGDYELFDILGYPRPQAEDILADFPPEVRDPVLAALKEARSSLVNKGISEDSKEARKTLTEAFERFGIKVIFTSSSDE